MVCLSLLLDKDQLISQTIATSKLSPWPKVLTQLQPVAYQKKCIENHKR